MKLKSNTLSGLLVLPNLRSQHHLQHPRSPHHHQLLHQSLCKCKRNILTRIFIVKHYFLQSMERQISIWADGTNSWTDVMFHLNLFLVLYWTVQKHHRECHPPNTRWKHPSYWSLSQGRVCQWPLHRGQKFLKTVQHHLHDELQRHQPSRKPLPHVSE